MDIDKLIEFASKKHEGQVDKGGNPYIVHPINVMLSLKTMDEKIVGLFHDILEDTDTTIEELKELGLTDEQILAIDILTRKKDQSYNEYIDEVASDPLTINVKIADLLDNMDLSRIEYPTEEDYKRLQKYIKTFGKLVKIKISKI